MTMFYTISPGQVLDVGSGSGYLAAVMATLVQDRGSKAPGLVIGVEYIPTLVEAALQSAERDPTSRPLLDAGASRERHDDWMGTCRHACKSWCGWRR